MRFKNIALFFLLAGFFLVMALPVPAPAAPVKTVIFKIPLTVTGG